MTRDEVEQRKKDNIQKRLNQTVLLCTEFLLTNLSDKDLANKTGMSSSTIGRRLTDENYITLSYPGVKQKLLNAGLKNEEIPESGKDLFNTIAKKRQENLLKGKSSGGKTTIIKYAFKKEEAGKFGRSEQVDIGNISNNVSMQYKFIGLIALHFRLHLNTLSDIFRISEDEILNNVKSVFSEFSQEKAFNYLFTMDTTDQILAREEFNKFYSLYVYANSYNNIDLKKEYIRELNDAKAKDLKKRRKCGDPLTNEDIEIIIRFQLKYALTTKDISYIFDIDRSNYNKRLNNFLVLNPHLKREYENLIAYNSALYKNGVRRG